MLFALKHTAAGPQLDFFMDVSDMINMTETGLKAQEKLTGVRNIQIRSKVRAFTLLGLRMRLDGAAEGPYLLKTEEPLDDDTLERYLKALPREDLIELLRKAKI